MTRAEVHALVEQAGITRLADETADTVAEIFTLLDERAKTSPNVYAEFMARLEAE